MSTEIFKWCPHFLDMEMTTKFRVDKSEFENMAAAQRRLLSVHGLHTWRFNYKTRLFDNDAEVKKLQDEISDFFNARYGGYENFYLPSFELESKATSFTSTSITLNMDATKLGFSETNGVYGNIIYICNRLYTINGTTGYYDAIRTISSITGTGNVTINFSPAITTGNFGTYPYVMKACKATFLNPELKRGFNNPYAWEGDIEFIEDRSDSFVVSLS